ncbi:MAG: hypothetical protein RBT84_17700, partial [FCB group bacterium]|nr:hypothetical protein [FCB group bacterium]
YSVANALKKHQRVSIHEGMVGLGSLLGAVGFGLLAEWRGTPWPFANTPLLIAGGLVLEAALLRMGYLLVRQKLPAKEPV